MNLRVKLTLATVCAVLLAACGGGGNGENSDGSGNVTINGRITFDRIVFDAQSGAGLNPTAPVVSPARQVVVEAIDAGTSTMVATSLTDTGGNYALLVPQNRNVFIRAKAQMLRSGAAPTWDYQVLNNTNSDALYVMDGSAASSGIANSTRNLHAASGWATTSYTGDRTAAPFAILDTVYRAKELILSADAARALPALALYWSVNNRPTVGQFCANTGDIPTTFYIGPNASDDCSAEGSLPAGIYILGAFENGNGDTDEFDQHVIAHEFGHYFEDRLSRSDSIGGSHGYVDRLDPRVAFSEAWGDAYAAMALNDPEYRDSISGVSSDGGFNLEHDETTAEGWFSEASIGEILWDIYDSIADGETVALGFTPIYSVMTNAQVSTDAVTSIFSFASALRSANPSSSSAIGSLLSGESISGSGAFGVGETNAGSSSTSLPIYTDITLNTPISICSSSTHGDDNKLGVHRFLKLVLGSSRSVSISATGAASGMGTIAAVDPDVWVNHQGTVTVRGEVTGAELFQAQLSAGTYILDVFDFDLMDTSSTRHCTNVSVAAQ